MQLLLMRHASAVRGGAHADVDRPLLAEGKLQAEWAGRALRRVAIEPVRAWTSPALRCRHTAEIVASHFASPGVPVEVNETLSVGKGGARILRLLMEAWFRSPKLAEAGPLLVVAHQPDLEELAALLLGRDRTRPLALEPGGCALLRLFTGGSEPRAATQWLLTPAWFELVAGI